MKKVNMELFDETVEKYNLRACWRDGLFTETEEDGQERESTLYQAAKKKYVRMVSSPKNDGSPKYLRWALETSLCIRSSKVAYRSSLDGRA